MAEEGNTPQDAPIAGGAAEQEGQQFGLQRIYLKDCSFESPRSPQTFQTQWSPKINFDIKTRSNKLQDDLYEVVLSLTAEATLEDEVAFVVETHQAGIYLLKDFDDAELERILATVCPSILYPYARETIDSLVVKGSFPALMLSPINFDALYAQKKQQEAEGGAPEAGESVQ